MKPIVLVNSKKFLEQLGDVSASLKVNKNIFTHHVPSDPTKDFILLVPQNYSFLTVQAHSISGTTDIFYTASDIKLANIPDLPADGETQEKFITADWMLSDLLTGIPAGETKMESIEHLVTAVKIVTTGEARIVLSIKDSI
jgi:hypothetical protein